MKRVIGEVRSSSESRHRVLSICFFPHGQDRLTQGVTQERVSQARQWHHEPIPHGDLTAAGHGAPENQPVAQRRQHPDRVEVRQPHESQPVGTGGPEGWLGITPVVADGLVKRSEQPLMRRSKDDQAPPSRN